MNINTSVLKYRMASKKEIAKMIGISERTLRNWLNVRYYDELAAIDYNKRQKQLTPKQVGYLDKKLNFWDLSD